MTWVVTPLTTFRSQLNTFLFATPKLVVLLFFFAFTALSAFFWFGSGCFSPAFIVRITCSFCYQWGQAPVSSRYRICPLNKNALKIDINMGSRVGLQRRAGSPFRSEAPALYSRLTFSRNKNQIAAKRIQRKVRRLRGVSGHKAELSTSKCFTLQPHTARLWIAGSGLACCTTGQTKENQNQQQQHHREKSSCYWIKPISQEIRLFQIEPNQYSSSERLA